jgi:hypothetical protein
VAQHYSDEQSRMTEGKQGKNRGRSGLLTSREDSGPLNDDRDMRRAWVDGGGFQAARGKLW